MDVRALHAFRIVAESGSITAAAARLGTVQSALSARIGQFEAAVGEPLFERLPRGIRLTAAGARLLPYAEKIEALVADAVRATHGREPRLSGPFRLGAIEVAAASVLSDGIARFLTSHPDVDLRLATGLSRELVDDVAAGGIDAAIIADGFRASDLASMPLRPIPLALFMPIDRPPEQLEQAFAFGHGCVCRARLETILHRRRWAPRIVELGSVDAILGCVEAGIGIALLPQALEKGRSVIAQPSGRLDLSLVFRPETETMARGFGSTLQQ
jgi:DNA-binding transcriptional LysR family regulator